MSEEKDKKKDKKKAVKDLKIDINEFGEMRTTINLDALNTFLNKNVADKKLIELKDAAKNKKKT